MDVEIETYGDIQLRITEYSTVDHTCMYYPTVWGLEYAGDVENERRGWPCWSVEGNGIPEIELECPEDELFDELHEELRERTAEGDIEPHVMELIEEKLY